MRSKWAYYSEKDNTVYINGSAILPDTRKLSFREHCKQYDKAFAMSYEDRINKFATDTQKAEILEIIGAHPGCNISEYTNVVL